MPSFSDLLGERQFVSQYSADDTVGFVVHKNGVPADADANNVVVKMETLGNTPTTIFQRTADHPATGVYETALSAAETSVPGLYKITWTYAIDTNTQSYIGILEIGEASAAYDNLPIGLKGVVESVWLRFADLFDSPYGGPHLQVYFQTRFGRGRIAQLLQIAVQKLNIISQPHLTYAADDKFPIQQWGGLLDELTYIEALKHLVRSYVEQPEAMNATITRMDRRDYMQRWSEVLQMEQEEAKLAVESFKIAHMGLSKVRVLVSGGVYGNYGPTRLAGSAAARPRYWARFY